MSIAVCSLNLIMMMIMMTMMTGTCVASPQHIIEFDDDNDYVDDNDDNADYDEKDVCCIPSAYYPLRQLWCRQPTTTREEETLKDDNDDDNILDDMNH